MSQEWLKGFVYFQKNLKVSGNPICRLRFLDSVYEYFLAYASYCKYSFRTVLKANIKPVTVLEAQDQMFK